MSVVAKNPHWGKTDCEAQIELLQAEASKLEVELRASGKPVSQFFAPSDSFDIVALCDALEARVVQLKMQAKLPRVEITAPTLTPAPAPVVTPPAPRLTSFTPDRYGPALIDATLATAEARVAALESVIVRAGGTPPRFFDHGAPCKDIKAKLLESHAEKLEEFCAERGVSLPSRLPNTKEKTSMSQQYTGATAKVLASQTTATAVEVPKANDKGEKLSATERCRLAAQQRDEAKTKKK